MANHKLHNFLAISVGIIHVTKVPKRFYFQALLPLVPHLRMKDVDIVRCNREISTPFFE